MNRRRRGRCPNTVDDDDDYDDDNDINAFDAKTKTSENFSIRKMSKNAMIAPHRDDRVVRHRECWLSDAEKVGV